MEDDFMIFDELFSREKLISLFGDEETTDLLRFYNENIQNSILVDINATADTKPVRDENPNQKAIFNKPELFKKDLIKLIYNLSPNSITNRSFNYNSVKLLDEEILNDKIVQMLRLYENMNEHAKYYDNGIIKPDFYSFPESPYNIYYCQKITIPDDSQIHYIGDIHGSLLSLLKMIVKDLDDYFNEDLVLKEKNYLIFTGDIVDYSQLGLECLYLVSMLKLKNPDRVFICDGNHEDYDQYSNGKPTSLGNELRLEIGNEDIRKNIIKLLQLFPTVIFVNFNNNIFQYNHGSHPTIENCNRLQLNEYLLSDKEFLLMYVGYTRNDILPYAYKWGDFTQLRRFSMERRDRPKSDLRSTQEYLNRFNINCIFSGHQDLTSLSVMSNRIIDGSDDAFRDKNYGYKLFIGYYNLLCFPNLKELGDSNEFNNKFVFDGKMYSLDSNGSLTTEVIDFPTERNYQYILNPSNLSQLNTELITPNRMIAMTQSSAGISSGKFINYTTFSTLKKT
jgi:hypothetical protein